MLRREPNRVWSQKLPSSKQTLLTMICMNFEQVSFHVSPHYKIDLKEYPSHEVFGFFSFHIFVCFSFFFPSIIFSCFFPAQKLSLFSFQLDISSLITQSLTLKVL